MRIVPAGNGGEHLAVSTVSARSADERPSRVAHQAPAAPGFVALEACKADSARARRASVRPHDRARAPIAPNANMRTKSDRLAMKSVPVEAASRENIAAARR